MRITVFTSNQPRHLSLIDRLAGVADEVYAIQECNTVFPGQVSDFFRKSEVMQRYFSRVLEAEQQVFGPIHFPPSNVRQLPLKMGDLNLLPLDSFGRALESDVFIVFGATFIKGPLCQHLVSRRAINIHMGVSPFYRGSSTNFWAMYDRRPQYVGATIHLLTAGLDSGPILYHAFPPVTPTDPFIYGMRAVQSAHQSISEKLAAHELLELEPVPQDKSLELRYTRNADFSDQVAADYLSRLPTPAELAQTLQQSDRRSLICPYCG